MKSQNKFNEKWLHGNKKKKDNIRKIKSKKIKNTYVDNLREKYE